VNLFGYLENKDVWVFQAPFDVRHHKLTLGNEILPVDVHLHI
jgi:hypothetical protein